MGRCFSRAVAPRQQVQKRKALVAASPSHQSQERKEQNREGNEEASHSKSKKPPVFKSCHIQFRIAGKTGGTEKKFLEDVSKRLSRQGVALRSKEFTETSEDPLLLFCPMASRMGSDIDNALQGLTGEQRILLVVMHYLQKDRPGPPVDTTQQEMRPGVVRTVHARYTLQDGFYPCEMNEAAVADVAAAIKDLA